MDEAGAVHRREVLEQLSHDCLRHLEFHRGISPRRLVDVEEVLGDAGGVVGLRHVLRERAIALELPHQPQAFLRDDTFAAVEVRFVGCHAERSEKVGAGPARVPRHPVVHPRLHLLKLGGTLHGELGSFEHHVPGAPRFDLALVDDAEGAFSDLSSDLDVRALVLCTHGGHPDGDAPVRTRESVVALSGAQGGNRWAEDPVRRHQSRAHGYHRAPRADSFDRSSGPLLKLRRLSSLLPAHFLAPTTHVESDFFKYKNRILYGPTVRRRCENLRICASQSKRDRLAVVSKLSCLAVWG